MADSGVPGASVQVHDPTGRVVAMVVTDASGRALCTFYVSRRPGLSSDVPGRMTPDAEESGGSEFGQLPDAGRNWELRIKSLDQDEVKVEMSMTWDEKHSVSLNWVRGEYCEPSIVGSITGKATSDMSILPVDRIEDLPQGFLKVELEPEGDELKELKVCLGTVEAEIGSVDVNRDTTLDQIRSVLEGSGLPLPQEFRFVANGLVVGKAGEAYRNANGLGTVRTDVD